MQYVFLVFQILCSLLLSTIYFLPQRSSYLAPLEDEDVAASEVISSYGSPQGDVLAEASVVVSLYSSPRDEVISSPSEVVNEFSSSKGEVISSSSKCSTLMLNLRKR